MEREWYTQLFTRMMRNSSIYENIRWHAGGKRIRTFEKGPFSRMLWSPREVHAIRAPEFRNYVITGRRKTIYYSIKVYISKLGNRE